MKCHFWMLILCGLIFNILGFSQEVFLPNQKLAGYKINRLEQLVDLKEKDIEISKAVALFCKAWDKDLDIPVFLKKLDTMAFDINHQFIVQKAISREDKIEIMIEYVFEKKKFKYTSKIDVRNFLLNQVIVRKKGHCLGLTTLLLCLGQRLKLDFRGVLAQGHIFGQIEDGKKIIYLEPGEQWNNFFLRSLSKSSANQAGAKSGLFFLPLSSRNFLACYSSNLAAYFQLKDNIDATFKYANFALSLNNRENLAFKLRGSIFFGSNMFEAAEFDLRRAFTVNEGDPELGNLLGMCYLRLHRYKEAEKVFLIALKYFPKMPSLNNNLAYCYFYLKKYRKSIKYAHQTICYNRDSVAAYANLFNVLILEDNKVLSDLERATKYSEAKIAAKQVIRLNPKSFLGYMFLIRLYLEIDQPQRALRAVKKAERKVNMEKSKTLQEVFDFLALKQKVLGVIEAQKKTAKHKDIEVKKKVINTQSDLNKQSP